MSGIKYYIGQIVAFHFIFLKRDHKADIHIRFHKLSTFIEIIGDGVKRRSRPILANYTCAPEKSGKLENLIGHFSIFSLLSNTSRLFQQNQGSRNFAQISVAHLS